MAAWGSEGRGAKLGPYTEGTALAAPERRVRGSPLRSSPPFLGAKGAGKALGPERWPSGADWRCRSSALLSSGVNGRLADGEGCPQAAT